MTLCFSLGAQSSGAARGLTSASSLQEVVQAIQRSIRKPTCSLEQLAGEEINRAVRFFTSGYDIYLPTNIAVTHNYSHASQAFFSYGPNDQGALKQKSRDRLARLFADGWVAEKADGQRAVGAGGLQGAANFGVGSQRSLEEFVRWGRVNLGGSWPQWMRDNGVTEMSDEETHRFCKTLDRLPVRDEVSLVASVSSKPDEFAADRNGNVKFYGDGEELDVRKLL